MPACPTDVTGPTTGYILHFQRAADGSFYQLWRINGTLNESPTVMRLAPGASVWRPLSVAPDGLHAIRIAPNGDVWGWAVQQVGGVDPEGGFVNSLFTTVYRMSGAD
jgi:hypothetical protein